MGTAKRPQMSKNKRPAISTEKFKTNAHLPLRRLIKIYAALILLTAACATMVALNDDKPTPLPDPFANGQQHTVSYGLYYPASLPVPYTIDKTSVSSPQSGVVTMRITNGLGSSADGRSMTISQQPVPTGFLFKTFYDSFSSKETYKSKLGDITIGSIDNGQTTLASLVAPDQTWILLSANANVSRDDIKHVMSNLTPQSPAK